MSHDTMLYKYGKHTRNFFGRFHFHFVSFFYILGAFLIKQLFDQTITAHSALSAS